MAIDPVCGMTVDEDVAAATSVHDGSTYYFCAPGCKRTFDANPAKVLAEVPKPMGGMPPASQMMMPTSTRQKPEARSVHSPDVLGSADRTTLILPIEGMSCASCVA